VWALLGAHLKESLGISWIPRKGMSGLHLWQSTQSTIRVPMDILAKTRQGRRTASGCSATLLVAEQDQIRPAAHPKLAQQIGNVKFYGALGNIQFVSNLFIRQIFQ
jgi:hypothetical protein